MDLTNILLQLKAEHEKISAAIAALQTIGSASSTLRRRGRPQKNSFAGNSGQAEKQERARRTKEQREAQAERMRQYWAARKAKSRPALPEDSARFGHAPSSGA